MRKYIRDGILGFLTGDALGVPVEFMKRSTIQKNPVTDMREYGTHNQSKGTWSDDSSMTLCTLDSLCNGMNYDDIMDKFCKWYYEDEYNPHGEVFDIGIATREALAKYKDGKEALQCGGTDYYSNGNGSLMRILPVVFYQYEQDHHNILLEPIANVSRLTHGHIISIIGCCIYAELIAALIRYKTGETELTMIEEMQQAILHVKEVYPCDALDNYVSLFKLDKLKTYPETSIKSTGYIVDTLEAAVWCFLTTSSYQKCVLKAVNLGDDTDTIGAIAGSIAGIYYGEENIPEEWLNVLARKQWVEGLIDKFDESL